MKKTIAKLKIDNGKTITNSLEILKAQANYYKKLYSSNQQYYNYNYEHIFQGINQIDDTQKLQCDDQITIDELETTLKTFKKNKPFTPFEQLMLVLPPTKASLLPKSYGTLMTSSSSPIIEYYPTDFKLDILAGEKYIYSEPLLPEINTEHVLKVIRPKRTKLSKTDQARNIINSN